MANELTSINQNIKDLVQGMKGHVQKLGSTIGGHISDVASEEMKMTATTIKSIFTFTKDTTIKTLAFFGKSFGLGWKTLKTGIGQLKVLTWIKNRMKREGKLKSGMFKKAKGGWVWLLGLLGIPLEWLGKGVLALTAIVKWFKNLAPIKKLLDSMKFGKLSIFFENMKKFFRGLPKLPGLKTFGTISKGFRFLTKFFIWLETFFLGWDFWKGWEEAEGKSIGEKFRAGFTNQIEKLFDRTIVWMFEMFDLIFKTDTTPTVKKATDKWSKIVVAFWATALTPFTGFENGLDSLLSELGITKKGEIDEWFKDFQAKIKSLPGLLLAWLKEWSGPIGRAWDFFGGGDIEKDIQRGSLPGSVIRPKNTFDDLKKLYPRENFLKADKQNEVRQGILTELKKNNEYQKKILEKESGSSTMVYSPGGQKPTMDIPAGTDIEKMTEAQIGYTF